MAIQFPNFLSVPVTTPDYSGLADAMENYYKGKAMPKDAMIKAVQAQFARPNAEEALKSSRLTNRKAQLDINKMIREEKEQKDLEDQYRRAMQQALSNNGTYPNMPAGIPMTAPPPAAPMNPNLGSALTPPAGYTPIQNQQAPVINSVGMTSPGTQQVAAAPQEAQPQPEAPNEITITKGSPHLAGIDMMYDNNPMSRQFLEKKGYKKSEEVKYDNKTGKTSVITKYPSGRITIKTINPVSAENDLENGIPLTKPVLNKVVNQIRGNDAVVPYIKKIIEMSDPIRDKKTGKIIGIGRDNKIPSTHFLPTDAQADFQAIISEALEKYMASSGFTQTDLSTKKTEQILSRAFGNSTLSYIRRLDEKLKEMEEDRARNVKMVTKGLKKYGNLEEEPRYSSSEWDKTNEQ